MMYMDDIFALQGLVRDKIRKLSDEQDVIQQQSTEAWESSDKMLHQEMSEVFVSF